MQAYASPPPENIPDGAYMQTNVAINADYEGDLGTNEADGYGEELEFVAMSNGNSSNYSPRQSCKKRLKITFYCEILSDQEKTMIFHNPNFKVILQLCTKRD